MSDPVKNHQTLLADWKYENYFPVRIYLFFLKKKKKIPAEAELPPIVSRILLGL